MFLKIYFCFFRIPFKFYFHNYIIIIHYLCRQLKKHGLTVLNVYLLKKLFTYLYLTRNGMVYSRNLFQLSSPQDLLYNRFFVPKVLLLELIHLLHLLKFTLHIFHQLHQKCQHTMQFLHDHLNLLCIHISA